MRKDKASRSGSSRTANVCLLAVLYPTLATHCLAQLNYWQPIGPIHGNWWGYHTVAVDSKDRNVVYTGTYHTADGYQGKVFKTTNAGQSWSALESGIDTSSVSKIVIDPVNPQVVFATKYPAGSGSSSHIYKSIDGGTTWQNRDPTSMGYLSGLAIANSDSRRMYMGGDKLYRSSDGGETWSGLEGPGNWGVDKIAVSPFNPDLLFASVCEYYDWENCNIRLYKSSDGGLSWNVHVLDLPGDDSISTIAFDPILPNVVYAAAAGYDTRSEPGIYTTEDLGLTWAFQPAPDAISQLEFDPRDPSTVYAVGPYNFARSNDRTATWAPFTNGIPLFGPGFLNVDFSKDGCFIYAATSTGVYYTRVREDVKKKTVADFDGDKATDLAIWRPDEGRWYLNNSVGLTEVSWGLKGDRLVVGDYDRDGRADFSVFRPSNNTWYRVHSGNGTIHQTEWGLPGDITVPNDYDGDGKNDLAVWRPSEGRWYINTGTTYRTFDWGLQGDLPVPSDYDNDGDAELGIYRSSEGKWYILNPLTGAMRFEAWGLPGDIPVPADYDGDGEIDLAVFRPSEGRWYIRPSMTGQDYSVVWGISSDTPVPGDYDADGRADIAVFRSGNGFWYRMLSQTGTLSVLQWGLEGDVPAPSVQME